MARSLSNLVFLVCLAAASRTGAAPPMALVAQGHYDNRAQTAKTPGKSEHAMPQVEVSIEATPQEDISLWHVHLQAEADAASDQTWAMQTRTEYDGSVALIPYFQLKQVAPAAAAGFDAHDWLSLEGCALRGEVGRKHVRIQADGMPCAVVSMNVGPRRALLPVGIEREGSRLRLDFDLGGKRARIELNRRD